MNLKDMKSHEELLLSLRTRIVEANGKLNIEEIDQMAATLGEAETYLDNKNNKLKLVGVLEQEFQDFEKIESNIRPPKTTSDGVHFQTNTSTEVPLNVAGGSGTKKKVNDGDSQQLQQQMIGNKGAKEAANKVDGDYHQSLQEEVVSGQPNNLDKVKAVVEVWYYYPTFKDTFILNFRSIQMNFCLSTSLSAWSS